MKITKLFSLACYIASYFYCHAFLPESVLGISIKRCLQYKGLYFSVAQHTGLGKSEFVLVFTGLGESVMNPMLKGNQQ